MLWVVVADKGSPGVTTTAALALAAASSEDDAPAALLVEADPGGGDLECWCGPLGAPGLLPAVTELRDRSSAARLADFATPAVAGVDVVAAPTRAMPTGAALRADVLDQPAGEGFATALAAIAADVFVDCGRWLPSAPAVLEAVVAAAEGVVVVCRPTLAGVEHARSAIDALGGIPKQTLVVLVGGSRPYEPEEVAAALGVPVAGVLPLDPRGVEVIVTARSADDFDIPLRLTAGTLLRDKQIYASRSGSVRVNVAELSWIERNISANIGWASALGSICSLIIGALLGIGAWWSKRPRETASDADEPRGYL